jgi:hypothetical protein
MNDHRCLATKPLKLRADHATEMDEILAQLDLVEAEQREQLDMVDREAHVMVTALTKELATKTERWQAATGRAGTRGSASTHAARPDAAVGTIPSKTPRHELTIGTCPTKFSRACPTGTTTSRR